MKPPERDAALVKFLAEKAMGWTLHPTRPFQRGFAVIPDGAGDGEDEWWNPLLDDGDAAELRRAMVEKGHGFDLEITDEWVKATIWSLDWEVGFLNEQPGMDGPAERRAVCEAIAQALGFTETEGDEAI